MHTNRSVYWLGLLALLAGAPAVAQINTGTPDELQGITVEEKLDVQVPLDLVFTDSTGAAYPLSRLFDDGKPVIITLNYYGCPMLCGLQLDAMIDALREVDLSPHRDYRLVTISFDPVEEAPLARLAKERYVSSFGREGALRGWTFMVGKTDAINHLCRTLGFRFRWNPSQQQWAHPAAAIVCTPDGRTSRYLGLTADARTYKLALLEAGQGRIGTFWDKVWLSCFEYSRHQGQYTPNVMAIMQLAGGATLALLVGLFIVFECVRRRMVRRQTLAAAPPGS